MGDVSAPAIRVLVVDDDALVRNGLALILGGGDIEVIGQAADGREALEAVTALRPDVVLMDIRMPVMDGIEATATLLARPDPPRVIVLTTFDTDDYVVRALGAGASGFLLKDTPPELIVEAVRKVRDGEPMLSPSVTSTLIQQVTQLPPDRRTGAQERLDRLTDREREVAVAVGRGLSNAQIAEELFLSVPTVKAHVGRVFAKLGLDNRVQIALLVHDAGLSGS